MKRRLKQLSQNPKVKQAVVSMKPEKSLFGILGVVVFFILPEVVAYFWGVDITHYAKESLTLSGSFLEDKYYEALIMLFEEGMGWVNLLIGLVMLVWLFF